MKKPAPKKKAKRSAPPKPMMKPMMKPPMRPMMGARDQRAMAQGMGGGGMMGMPGAGALDRLMQG